jgi:hypothetical protein
MSLVEVDGMAGEKTGHDRMERDRAGLEKQMDVITEEGPHVTGGVCFGKYPPHLLHKAVSIDIITEDQSSLHAPDDDVVEHTRCDEAGMAGHGQSYQTGKGRVKG